MGYVFEKTDELISAVKEKKEKSSSLLPICRSLEKTERVMGRTLREKREWKSLTHNDIVTYLLI